MENHVWRIILEKYIFTEFGNFLAFVGLCREYFFIFCKIYFFRTIICFEACSYHGLSIELSLATTYAYNNNNTQGLIVRRIYMNYRNINIYIYIS